MVLLLLAACILAAFNARAAADIASARAATLPTSYRGPWETTSPPPDGNWQQVWIDDFDTFENDPHANDNWTFYLTNDGHNASSGWGNGEYQYYTNNPKNIRAENGNLLITVQVETDNKPYSSNGVAFDLTSARISTRDHHSWGVNHRFLLRAKLPTARATWPAFWHEPQSLFPGDPLTVWPKGGELDTMEHWANRMGMLACSTHTVATDGHTKRETTKRPFFPNGQTFFADFHIFECQLRADRVDFFFDSNWVYGLSQQGCLDNGIDWPWTRRDFYSLINLALIEYHFDWTNRKQEIIDALKNSPEVTRQYIIDYFRVDKLL